MYGDWVRSSDIEKSLVVSQVISLVTRMILDPVLVEIYDAQSCL